MPKSRQLACLALTINAVIWGCAFAIVKPVFEYLSPLQFLYLRFLVAGIFSIPIFLYFYIRIQPKISYLIKVLLIELFGTALPLLILYEGLARTHALQASLIGATGPIFIVLGGIIFLHEKETKCEWQGLALSLIGSLMLVASPLLSNGLGNSSNATGNLLILLYNLLYAIYAVIAKHTYKSKPPLYLGSLTYLATALIYGLILFYSGTLPPLSILSTSYSILAPVLYMALPGGVLAFMLYLYAQSKIEVSEANLFTYLNGVVAIPASFFLLGEKPGVITILSILLIAYGVYRAEIRRH